METIGARIRLARLARRYSQDYVAKNLRRPVNRVSVTQWENDTTAPERDRIPELAELLQTTSDWLMSANGMPPEGVVTTAPSFPPVFIPGKQLVSDNLNLPVYAAAQAGSSGYEIVTFDPIDWVKRPTDLENVKGGYGLLFRGTSMVPAYRDGDIGLVHPHLQPQRDTDVVLYGKIPGEEPEMQAKVKQLNGWNDDTWTLEQFNPPMVFQESRKAWPICHRIVGKYSRR